jgi:hypothetical protein
MYVHIYIYDLKRHILYIQQLKCHSAWAQAGPPDGSHLGRGKVGDDVTRHGPLSSLQKGAVIVHNPKGRNIWGYYSQYSKIVTNTRY